MAGERLRRLSSWEGQRLFEGIWDTSFGLLRSVQEADRVLGFYEGREPVSLEGRRKDGCLTFRYREARAQGGGRFELTSDAAAFDDEWRADGSAQWAVWCMP